VVRRFGEENSMSMNHWLKVVQTQKGIIEYAEAMAQVLAEAGRASQKAVGDSAESAVRKWVRAIEDRAIDILRKEQQPERKKIAS
jgi:hypothetical protein